MRNRLVAGGAALALPLAGMSLAFAAPAAAAPTNDPAQAETAATDTAPAENDPAQPAENDPAQPAAENVVTLTSGGLSVDVSTEFPQVLEYDLGGSTVSGNDDG